NMIYARHGYSFKNRPLRVFFDAQEWYIPVHTDIKKDLTEIEKKNIQLLLKYEKNAKEYYDYFGRG
ncbi:MAG: YARHG domain-containing protein, partial [Chitinophagales bacterium]